MTDVIFTGLNTSTLMTSALQRPIGSQKAFYSQSVANLFGTSPTFSILVGTTLVYQAVMTGGFSVTAEGNLALPSRFFEPPATRVANALTANNAFIRINQGSIYADIFVRVGGGTGYLTASGALTTSAVVRGSVVLLAPASLDVGVTPPVSTVNLGNITFVGDSLFRGNVDEDFYSPVMYFRDKLAAAGFVFNIVGSSDEWHDSSPGDLPISANGGWTVQDIQSDIPAMAASQPRHIIVSIGTNNMALAATNITAYLNAAESATSGDANRKIYACAPRNAGWFDATAYANTKSAMQSWVAAAPTRRYYRDLTAAGVTQAETIDGTHWTEVGAQKIAQYLYTVFQDLY